MADTDPYSSTDAAIRAVATLAASSDAKVRRESASTKHRGEYRADGLYAAPADSPQVTPTSDATGQGIHPDVAYFENGWRGYKYWMSMTPYPGGVSTTENPEILVSNDGASWVVPPGTTNPIAKPTTGFWPDPDLTYEPAEDRLYMMWLGMRASYTDDGKTWAASYPLFTSLTGEVAPSVVREAPGVYRMWSVQKTTSGPHKILVRTGNGLHSGATWSAPVEATYTLPGTHSPWHMDVKRINGTYVSLVSCCLQNSDAGGGCRLHAATSQDGLTWEFSPSPILAPRSGKWDGFDIYRSCLVPASGGGIADVWYSARSIAPSGGSSEWRTGRTVLQYRSPSSVRADAPSTFRDTVSVKPQTRNLLAPLASTSLLASNGRTDNGVGPQGWTNNFLAIAPAAKGVWDEVEEAFSINPAAGNNMNVSGIPVTEGKWYTVSYWMKAATSAITSSCSIHWVNSGGTNVSTAGGPIIAGDGTWRRVSHTAQAPVGAVTMKMWITFPATGARLIRDAQCEEGGLTDFTPSAGLQVSAPGSAGFGVYGPVVAATGRRTYLWVGPQGQVVLPPLLTADMLTAATAGKGALAYDATLGLSVSNGTTWRAVEPGKQATAVKTASYTLTSSDQVVISDSATAATLVLPTPSTMAVGQTFTLKNVNATGATITTNDGSGIDGVASTPLAQWATVTVVNSGTKWYRL